MVQYCLFYFLNSRHNCPCENQGFSKYMPQTLSDVLYELLVFITCLLLITLVAPETV